MNIPLAFQLTVSDLFLGGKYAVLYHREVKLFYTLSVWNVTIDKKTVFNVATSNSKN